MKNTLHSNGQPLVRLGNILKLLCAAALLAAVAPVANASDPTGIYGFVERVVFEPSDTSPERIQVWGGFALANKKDRDSYHDAARGYLYFKLRPGEEEICKKEWADLKSVAGTSEIVAFGSRHTANPPTLRKADAKPENAEVYPTGWGMRKVRRVDYGPVKQLVALQGKKANSKEPSKSGK